MPVPQDKVIELRIKELEMVQAIITRLAGYGAVIKNWCITVTTGVCGFAISQHKPAVILLAFLPIIVFSILDAEYLRAERRYRAVFNRLRSEDWNDMPTFDLRAAAASPIEFANAYGSWSILSFYLPIALGVAIMFLVANLSSAT
jgi:hypothetical protein